MLFNSLTFLFFLPIVFILHWSLPHKWRWFLLLLASYYFYMSWNVKYILFIIFITLMSYISALLIEVISIGKIKKIILMISLISCLGTLVFFKYFNFIASSLEQLLSRFSIDVSSIALSIYLPVGISFYVFQAISYVIDVYRGYKAEWHLGYYALFISFFPQLVAGPIERTDNLLPQLKRKRQFNYEQATEGMRWMLWGYYKKLLIADVISSYISKIYEEPRRYIGFSLIIAVVLFSFEIYCDFSGYSDIAIGAAKIMGIDFKKNFSSPYLAQNVKEFWGRWHISLSKWFKDYVYIPMGGNHVGKIRHRINLMITFLLSGLWHGADWTFIVWGGIHGAAQVFEQMIFKNADRNQAQGLKIPRIIINFAFVTITWVFFAAYSLQDACYIICHLFVGISSPITYLYNGFTALGISMFDLANLVIAIFILILFDIMSLSKNVMIWISEKNICVRWSLYIIFTLMIIFFSQKEVASEFIYFQF